MSQQEIYDQWAVSAETLWLRLEGMDRSELEAVLELFGRVLPFHRRMSNPGFRRYMRTFVSNQCGYAMLRGDISLVY